MWLKLCLILLFTSVGVYASLQARASHILVDSESKVDELRAEIEATEDKLETFAKLAKIHSECPSGKSGGDLGQFGRGMMVPEFDSVVFENDIHTVHKVKTQFGWHLVYTTERTGDDGNSGRESEL